MSRNAWLITSAALFSIACAGSGGDDGKRTNDPVDPDDTRSTETRGADGDVQPGVFFNEGADGVRLELAEGSYRCNNTCSAVCSDCLFDACMASGGDTTLCIRSRDACSRSCGVCLEGGSDVACYSPCLKGEPTCYEGFALVMPEDETRPEVLPGREQVTPDDETRPASDGYSSSDDGASSSSSGSSSSNSGRPAN